MNLIKRTRFSVHASSVYRRLRSRIQAKKADGFANRHELVTGVNFLWRTVGRSTFYDIQVGRQGQDASWPQPGMSTDHALAAGNHSAVQTFRAAVARIVR